jgi:hypothetical protein
MLFEWLVTVLAAIVDFLIAALDALVPDPPAFIDDIPGYVDTLNGYLDGTDVWIPWEIVGPMIAVVGVAFLASWAIKIVRIVASYLTAGGGSAG